jgi:hypothetical protein
MARAKCSLRQRFASDIEPLIHHQVLGFEAAVAASHRFWQMKQSSQYVDGPGMFHNLREKQEHISELGWCI